MNEITVRGARMHNLKNIDLTIPRGKLVVFTGLSGSGKSSLAFDTLYADVMTRSIKSALYETERRRRIQKQYNEEHGITPKTVQKGIRELIAIGTSEENRKRLDKRKGRSTDPVKETPAQRQARIEDLTEQMKRAAKELRFEEAAYLRDKIRELQIVK